MAIVVPVQSRRMAVHLLKMPVYRDKRFLMDAFGYFLMPSGINYLYTFKKAYPCWSWYSPGDLMSSSTESETGKMIKNLTFRHNGSAAWWLPALMAITLAGWMTSVSAGQPGSRVIGGEAARSGEIPWQVGVAHGPEGARDIFQQIQCGGTLITPQWIVSAAHCFGDYTDDGTHFDIPLPQNLYIVAGINDLRLADAAVIRNVARLIIHPDYDPHTTGYDNDIALLFVEEPVTCPACLPIDLVTPANERNVASPATMGLISGWGSIGERQLGSEFFDLYPFLLQKALVPILDNASCITDMQYMDGEITDNMFCAGYQGGGRDTCQGDSGGPLAVLSSDGTGYLLAGVTSWGEGCAKPYYPGVYTRVSHFSDWITFYTQEDEESSRGGGGAMSPVMVALLILLVMGKGLLRGGSSVGRRRS